MSCLCIAANTLAAIEQLGYILATFSRGPVSFRTFQAFEEPLQLPANLKGERAEWFA